MWSAHGWFLKISQSGLYQPPFQPFLTSALPVSSACPSIVLILSLGHRYSTTELRRLPLNSVCSGPLPGETAPEEPVVPPDDTATVSGNAAVDSKAAIVVIKTWVAVESWNELLFCPVVPTCATEITPHSQDHLSLGVQNGFVVMIATAKINVGLSVHQLPVRMYKLHLKSCWFLNAFLEEATVPQAGDGSLTLLGLNCILVISNMTAYGPCSERSEEAFLE